MLKERLGKTRYSNPLKQKFKAKRLASESVSDINQSRSFLNSYFSGRSNQCSSAETSKRSNAGRISPSQQDSLSTKSPGIGHEGPITWAFQPVRYLILILPTENITYPRYPNLHEVRLIPTKKDIAFVEYTDEASSTVAKDALHNYKLDGENKIKVCHFQSTRQATDLFFIQITFARK